MEHRYGQRVHIVDSPYLSTLIAIASDVRSEQHEVIRAVRAAYRQLMIAVVDTVLDHSPTVYQTRMGALAECVGVGDPTRTRRIVVLSIARGGIIPSQECLETLLEVAEPGRVRQDLLVMTRVQSADGGFDAEINGRKAGRFDDAVVIIPDPMGATGTTVSTALAYVGDHGRPSQVIIVCLMIAPEFIRRIFNEHPTAEIFCGRVDRGLSERHVLESVPGIFFDEERGLNDHGYIIPGAGDIGDVLNNTEGGKS